MGEERREEEMKLCSNPSSFCTSHVFKELCKRADEKK
jgi:hypothetical protein